MKTVQVLMFSGNNPYDLAIKYITWSHYSHCGIVINGYYYDAKPSKGVEKLSVNDIPRDYDLFGVTVTDLQYEKIQLFLDAQVGKPYDFIGIARFILRTPPSQNHNEWFCSSLIFAAFLAAGIRLLGEKDYKITPASLPESPYLKYLGKITV